MTREEIKNRIEEIENRIWWINMADRLTNEDYKALNNLAETKRYLKRILDN